MGISTSTQHAKRKRSSEEANRSVKRARLTADQIDSLSIVESLDAMFAAEADHESNGWMSGTYTPLCSGKPLDLMPVDRLYDISDEEDLIDYGDDASGITGTSETGQDDANSDAAFSSVDVMYEDNLNATPAALSRSLPEHQLGGFLSDEKPVAGTLVRKIQASRFDTEEQSTQNLGVQTARLGFSTTATVQDGNMTFITVAPSTFLTQQAQRILTAQLGFSTTVTVQDGIATVTMVAPAGLITRQTSAMFAPQPELGSQMEPADTVCGSASVVARGGIYHMNQEQPSIGPRTPLSSDHPCPIPNVVSEAIIASLPDRDSTWDVSDVPSTTTPRRARNRRRRHRHRLARSLNDALGRARSSQRDCLTLTDLHDKLDDVDLCMARLKLERKGR